MTTSHKLTEPAQALQFLLAGKAVVTLKSTKTGNHLTFKVKATKDAGANGPSHFVAIRTGGAGEKNFAYLGFLKGGRQYVHGRKSKIDQSDTRVRAFRFVHTRLLWNEMPPNCEIWHEGTCGRCGRALTDPTSIASGVGPECATKIKGW
jgi:hypothetical protein